MQENTDQRNSKYGHFLYSELHSFFHKNQNCSLERKLVSSPWSSESKAFEANKYLRGLRSSSRSTFQPIHIKYNGNQNK